MTAVYYFHCDRCCKAFVNVRAKDYFGWLTNTPIYIDGMEFCDDCSGWLKYDIIKYTKTVLCA